MWSMWLGFDSCDPCDLSMWLGFDWYNVFIPVKFVLVASSCFYNHGMWLHQISLFSFGFLLIEHD